LESLDFDCANRKLRALTFVTYDEDGTVVQSKDGSRIFQSVIPDTVGESLLSGLCQAN
jgi:hypothetical protein